jgi:uncharacterized protein YjiS (DUF1127 family)
MTVATLDGLIREVKAASDDVLAQLEVASGKATELTDLGDALLNHFVDRCRRSGATWAEIGEHLGVTRQAVQKRFVDSVGDGVTFERFTMRARQALDRAQEEAKNLQHNYVGTEHELLALFEVGEGIAARALADLGVTREAVEREVLARVGKGPKPVAGPFPFTPRARKVLEEAVNAALDLGHNYIGTEHLLLGLFRGQSGLAMQVLESLGATKDLTKQSVSSLLAGFKPPATS